MLPFIISTIIEGSDIGLGAAGETRSSLSTWKEVRERCVRGVREGGGGCVRGA